MINMKNKSKKKYWYKITCVECPVCGSGETYRERQYTKRPKDAMKRHEYKQTYDQCMERG